MPRNHPIISNPTACASVAASNELRGRLAELRELIRRGEWQWDRSPTFERAQDLREMREELADIELQLTAFSVAAPALNALQQVSLAAEKVMA